MATCPVCGQDDETEPVLDIYKGGTPRLGFQLRPPTVPRAPAGKAILDIPPHPDEPEKPYQDRSAVTLTWRGFLPLFVSFVFCAMVWRLANLETIYVGENILFIVILLFVLAPLSLLLLFFTGSWVYRWARWNLFGPTYSERMQARIETIEDNHRRRAHNAKLAEKHARNLELHEAVTHKWERLRYCHRDDVIFDPQTGEHHEREGWRKAMLVPESGPIAPIP